jgi:hypothetical protein
MIRTGVRAPFLPYTEPGKADRLVRAPERRVAPDLVGDQAANRAELPDLLTFDRLR